MRDLLHPPAHRGPLIAAGALTLAIGVATLLARLEPGAGTTLALTAALAATLLWLALQGERAGGPPPPFVSVLLVTGLAALAAALLALADVVGAEADSATATWASAVVAGAALWAARARSSAIAALIGALAAGGSVLAAWDWAFSPATVTPFRWLLLALAIVYALVSLPLRGTSLRHAVQMVNAAGVAVLAIPLLEAPEALFGDPRLPGFWEGVVLCAGFGLVAHASADRVPGPAYLGAANLAAFVALAGPGEDTLVLWPLLLVGVGGIALGAGLRPRAPLPPEPDSSTRPDDLPLTVRVRRD
jgi:hypothetical protein